jgi:hypothetical protein
MRMAVFTVSLLVLLTPGVQAQEKRRELSTVESLTGTDLRDAEDGLKSIGSALVAFYNFVYRFPGWCISTSIWLAVAFIFAYGQRFFMVLTRTWRPMR